MSATTTSSASWTTWASTFDTSKSATRPKNPAAAASSRTSGRAPTSGGKPRGDRCATTARRPGRCHDLRRTKVFRLAHAEAVRLLGPDGPVLPPGPLALLYGFADVWQRPALVRGWENMFFDMMDRPERAHFLCRKFADFYCEDYTRAAEATGGRIDLYLLLTDLGGQNGPLISLATFREVIAPYLKQMFDCIHGLGAKVLYHSCGQIRAFIPDLIALGVDVLNPIQPIGAAMAPEGLKADFGDRLCFHGGIDTQGLLPHGSPAEIRREVRRYCETLGRGGGYIVAPAHNFQPDVPAGKYLGGLHRKVGCPRLPGSLRSMPNALEVVGIRLAHPFVGEHVVRWLGAVRCGERPGRGGAGQLDRRRTRPWRRAAARPGAPGSARPPR